MLNAIVTWTQLYLDDDDAESLELGARIALPLSLVGAIGYFVVWPVVTLPARHDWPDETLARGEGVEYHTFEVGKNVFPPAAPGQPDPRSLVAKTYNANGYAPLQEHAHEA